MTQPTMVLKPLEFHVCNGVNIPFDARLHLFTIELVLVAHVCHHSLNLNHHVLVRAHLATSPTSHVLGER